MLLILYTIGDQIISVNDTPMQGLKHNEAVLVLKEAKEEVVLSVVRKVYAKKILKRRNTI